MKSDRSSADHVDIHRKILFAAMLVLSLIFALKSASYLIEERYSTYLKIGGYTLATLLFMLIGLAIFWKFRFIPGKNISYLMHSTDNFVNSVMNRASTISWVLTFIVLVFIMTRTERDFSLFPTEFYLNVTAFFMLASFSASFFILFSSWQRNV